MTDTKFTKGPYRFEPHGGFGTTIEGEEMPFGYISTSTPTPIFEIKPILGFPVSELIATANLLSASPSLYEALEGLADFADKYVNAVDVEPLLVSARAALALARGEA